MRILIEPSDYTLLNAGDMAMLHVAFARVKTLWPSACIQVFTDDAQQLAVSCPGAQPVITRGRAIWFADGYLFGSLKRYLPNAMLQLLWQFERALRRRLPSLVMATMRSRMLKRGADVRDLDAFWNAVTRADVLIVAGMGGITDAFPEFAYELLDVLALADQYGVPTALFGQGLGPINDPKLRARAAAVLPKAALIALREGRAGTSLLQSIGVAADRVHVTGDDAIEIAYQTRHDSIGTGIGINLRVGQYAEVQNDLMTHVGLILQDIARRHHASLVPVPISRYPVDSDADVIRQLSDGYPHVLGNAEPLDTPLKIIKQIQQCRVVVTGSYHAAVFALAQGIPAVGLAKSAYYVDKFSGLNDQFGQGSAMVCLDDANLPIALAEAIDRAWHTASEVRPHLLAAASRQIDMSRAAYQQLHALVPARDASTS